MIVDKLFMMEDRIFRNVGLYAMWTCLYIANFVTLLVDPTQGPVRDFNIIANGLSVIYCATSSAVTIFGNGLPSTFILLAGPIHQYLYWLLLAYYGGSPPFSGTPTGVMNWINSIIVGIFTLDMIVKTWVLAISPNTYKDYVKRQLKKREEGAQVSSA